MLTEFIQQKMKTARIRKLEDGMYYGEIPGARGVWAHASSMKECRRELREVFEEWLLLKIQSDEKIAGFTAPSRGRKKAPSYA